VLRAGSSRVYLARSAVYALNEADIPPCRRASASLRPIGTSDAQKSICRAQGVQLISQHVKQELNYMKTSDLIYLETDDSCAICGAKGIGILSEHHIDSNRSNNEYDNLIVLCHNCHHKITNKKGLSEEEIINRKKHLINKTITTYGLNAMKIAKRNNFGVIALPFLLYHLVDLGYMSKEEDQMGYGEQDDATSRFAITEKGISILDKWFA
jgi:5-methylcytosine-specific restriction endonuclease McrA